jgi:hypothetical protein
MTPFDTRDVWVGFDNIIGPDNDLLVPADSQRGGLTDTARTVSTFTGKVHSGPFAPSSDTVLNSQDIVQRVIDLLQGTDDTLFNTLP